ncbi:MAG: hypothetical protein JW787_00575 [Sedimentisphaerales bacterium]|nr:hypothetical protein [Sedimentisphaerales bacterium]
MGFIKCPFCGQEIDSDARKCFYCDSDLNHNSYYTDAGHISEHRNSNYTLKMEHPISPTKIVLFIILFAAFLSLAFFIIRHFN